MLASPVSELTWRTMSLITTQNNWSLRKEIFDYLVGQIENGKLKPGSLINVRQLTEELDVSRTPLREALAQMEVKEIGIRGGYSSGVTFRVNLEEDLSYEAQLGYRDKGAIFTMIRQKHLVFIIRR